jgi:transcriptional regulator with XRE-family HTH domain
MSFAQRLKQARQRKGFSQTELGEKAGVHYTQIGRYEKGALPAADILAGLANALEVSADFLMSGSLEEVANETITDKELLAQFKRLEGLPNERKRIVKELIEAFLFKSELQQKLAS